MRKTTVILTIICLLVSATLNTASAAGVEKTELSPQEAQAFAHAQSLTSAAAETQTGGDIVGALAIIGLVTVAVILIGAAN